MAEPPQPIGRTVAAVTGILTFRTKTDKNPIHQATQVLYVKKATGITIVTTHTRSLTHVTPTPTGTTLTLTATTSAPISVETEQS